MFKKGNSSQGNKNTRLNPTFRKLTIPMLAGLLLAVFIIALFLGRYIINPPTVILILLSKFFPSIPQTWTSVMQVVVWDFRLPRAVAVILVGSGLAVSGATFQATFRNPLVSESILGVTAGAAVGAQLGVLLNQSYYAIQLFAFGFALLAVGLTFTISRVYRSNPTLVLVLAGVIVATLFSAVQQLLTFIGQETADQSKLQHIFFSLTGSFANITLADVYPVVPLILVPMFVIVLLRWRLNILSMGEDDAKSLGVNTKILRNLLILCVTLITAAAVYICGIIVWVGLIIPHIGRMIVGSDHKILIPASILLGASYLLIVDTICRTLTPNEIPIGIVTAFVGAPIFLYLLKKNTKSWS
jgi:iron complex transport system permease protein